MTRLCTALAVLALSACTAAAPAVRADVKSPQLPAQDMVVLTQTLTDCAVKLTATVEAADEPLQVEKAVYEFVVDGAVLQSGEHPLNVAVAPGQKADVSLEQSFTYVKGAEESKAMDGKGGSLLLSLRGHLVVTVLRPAEGTAPAEKVTVELPFARAKEVRTPRHPHLKLQDLEAYRSSDTEIQVVFHLGVVNPNNFQLSMSGLAYQVTLGAKMMGEGTLGAGEKVSPASTGVFDVSITLNEESYGPDAKKLIATKLVPYVLTAKLKAPLYEENLESKADIKLNVSK